MLIMRKTIVSWQAFPSLLPRAPLAFLSRPKLPFLKLPFPSLSNASHAGYLITSTHSFYYFVHTTQIKTVFRTITYPYSHQRFSCTDKLPFHLSLYFICPHVPHGSLQGIQLTALILEKGKFTLLALVTLPFSNINAVESLVSYCCCY